MKRALSSREFSLVPELHHIKDAVVLPQNGDRGIASMCSGGGLRWR